MQIGRKDRWTGAKKQEHWRSTNERMQTGKIRETRRTIMSDNSISFVTVEIYILLNIERYKSRSIVSSSLVYCVTKTLCYRLFSTLA
jgi:hypothetical protein